MSGHTFKLKFFLLNITYNFELFFSPEYIYLTCNRYTQKNLYYYFHLTLLKTRGVFVWIDLFIFPLRGQSDEKMLITTIT